MKASVAWPTRETEADYRRAVDLLLRPHHGNGLDGLLLLRSLAVEGRHPAASWTLRACRRRFPTRSGSQASGDEDWAAGIDWDVAMEVWRVHAERDDHPIAHYLLSGKRSKIFACKVCHPWSPHLQRAADLGYPLAIKALAVCYVQGLQVPTNLSEAVKLYEKAVDAGDIDAQYEMSAACLRDRDPAQRARAIGMLEKAVALGQPQAMTRLGLLYNPHVIPDGRAVGLERDQAKAFALFQRAADLGDPEAMHHLAEAHAEGKGVPRDARRAFQLCCEAALRGSSAALLRLFSQFGLSGHRHEGLSGDPELALQALECMRQCALRGYGNAWNFFIRLLATQFAPVAADEGATASPTSLFHICCARVNREIEAEILARAAGGDGERPGPFERAVATRVPCDARERMTSANMRLCDRPGCRRKFFGDGRMTRAYCFVPPSLSSSSSSSPPAAGPEQNVVRLHFCSVKCWRDLSQPALGSLVDVEQGDA